MDSGEWYYLSGETLIVERQTEKAYQLVFTDTGLARWVPKSVVRITPGKDTWEVKAWWIKKNDLLEIVVDEDPH